MTKVTEKLKNISKPNHKGGWKELVRFRNQNKAWLRKSSAIALKILNALDTPGWSQARLARELGISPQMVSKIVKGHENFTLESLSKIEAVLGIELVSVLKEDDIVVKRQDLDILIQIQSAMFKTAFEKEEVTKTTKSDGGTYVSSKIIESTIKELSKQNRASMASAIGESNYAIAC